MLEGWHGELGRGSLVMTWAETAASGALGLRTLGAPTKEVIDHEGVLLVRRALTPARSADLRRIDEGGTVAPEAPQDSGSLTS